MNVGEELVNVEEELVIEYLEYIKECELVLQNLYTPEVGGEIDVVGFDYHKNVVYVCIVAIDLAAGLMYVDSLTPKPINSSNLIEKFTKAIEYANMVFPNYSKVFMLWSPQVEEQTMPKTQIQLQDLEEVSRYLQEKYNVELQLIINKRFYECLQEMKAHANKGGKEIKRPFMRFFQLETCLEKSKFK